MDVFQILVIILSICLAVFLVLGIALLILLIRISVIIKRITGKIEYVGNNLQDFLISLSQLIDISIITKLAVKYIRNYINKKRSLK